MQLFGGVLRKKYHNNIITNLQCFLWKFIMMISLLILSMAWENIYWWHTVTTCTNFSSALRKKNHNISGVFCFALGKYIKITTTSNIRCTKSQNLNVSRFVLQLSLPNSLKPSVKSRIKMWLEQCRQAMLQLHLSVKQFQCLLRCNL